jgi:type VI secretion system protein ImpM
VPGDPMSFAAMQRASKGPAAVRVGFFGKIPARGDFVQAGLSRHFTQAWDGWVQAVLPPCRKLFGQSWEDVWRAAPCCRFALPGGQCGAAPVLGLLLPSADRAGRLFPFMIAAEGADDGSGFLDAAEQVGRDAVGGALSPDLLLSRLADIVPPPPVVDMALGMTAGRWWSGQGSPAADAVVLLTGLPDATALAGMLRR